MDISALKIPLKKVGQFQSKGIETVEQLLTRYPTRYKDYRNYVPLSEVQNYVGQAITILGQVCNLRANYSKGLVFCAITDGKNHFVNITWFNQIYLIKKIADGDMMIVHGKLAYQERYGYSISGPTYFSQDISRGGGLIPVYPAIKGLSAEYYGDCLYKALAMYAVMPTLLRNPINTQTEKNLGLMPQKDFIKIVHHPKTDADLEAIEKRKAAELLIPFVKELREKESVSSAPKYTSINEKKTFSEMAKIRKSLPYALTQDQEKAIKTMIDDVLAGNRLNVLIQGDVGCGKTIVALFISAFFALNDYQVVVMAPTKILAEQHHSEFSSILQKVNITPLLLTEGLTAKEKRIRLQKIESGEAKIIIGTSSVLSEKITYKNLCLVITDEEHRFGVAQRAMLLDKAKDGVHSINMSATPIPRSLAVALSSQSTKIIDIKTMPAGRKPVQTILYGNEEKTFEAMYRQIRLGHQCYIVCPLIESKSDTEIDSVETTLKKATAYFEKYHPKEVNVAAITGKTGKKKQQEIISSFAAQRIDILIATTVVEVGVNVPNATVMVIKNAERFGLAQLHQLRGRVGRSSAQSYCVLLSHDKQNKRLLTMVQTTDGFEIAKADLEQRGAGDILGTEQSGFNAVLACVATHRALYQSILEEAGKTF